MHQNWGYTSCLRSRCRCLRIPAGNLSCPPHQRRSAPLSAATCPEWSCSGCPCSSGPPRCGTSLRRTQKSGDPIGFAAEVSFSCEFKRSKCWVSEPTWVLNEVGLHQVVQDVVLTNPLHRAAAGGAERRTLHPARVAGGAEDVHARLQAEAEPLSFYPSGQAAPLKTTKIKVPNLTQSYRRSWQITQVKLSSILSVFVWPTGALVTLFTPVFTGPTSSVVDMCGKSGQ